MIVSTPQHWLHSEDIVLPFSNEIHIWFIDLEEISIDFKNILTNLPLTDQERLNLIKEDLRREFSTKKHFILLKILSFYLKKEISTIELSYNKFGKPFLESSQLKFNVSNSFNYLLVGISSGVDIGVDIEKFRRNVRFEKLVERYFTEKEKKFFKTLPETKQEVFFFDLWTMKEAVVKATGLGMRLPFNSFEFPLDENEDTIQVTYDSKQKDFFVCKCLVSNDTSITICLEKKVDGIKYFKF